VFVIHRSKVPAGVQPCNNSVHLDAVWIAIGHWACRTLDVATAVVCSVGLSHRRQQRRCCVAGTAGLTFITQGLQQELQRDIHRLGVSSTNGHAECPHFRTVLTEQITVYHRRSSLSSICQALIRLELFVAQQTVCLRGLNDSRM
jgi:hypothetical protein